MARSGFRSPRVVVVVAGQQLHQTAEDFHRSQANETNSDYYFYKQVARSSLLRVYTRANTAENCVYIIITIYIYIL